MRGNMNFCMYSLSSWVMGHLFFEREFWKVSFVNEDNIFLDIYAIFVTFPCAPFARTNEECRYKEYERITITGWKLSVRRRLYLSDLIVDILRKIIILPPSYTWKETARQKIYVRDRMKFAQWKKFLLSQRLSREGGWDGEIWNERRRKISWVRNGPESYENSTDKRKGALRELDLGISPVRRWGWTYRTEGLALRGGKDTWRCSKGAGRDIKHT